MKTALVILFSVVIGVLAGVGLALAFVYYAVREAIGRGLGW